MAQLELITINWSYIEQRIKEILDVNDDGAIRLCGACLAFPAHSLFLTYCHTFSGQVDEKDLQEGYKKFRSFVTFGMTSTAGFGGGLVLGLACG